MDGEGQPLRGALKELADGLPPLVAPPFLAVPNGVFSEQLRQGVGVILVVAQGAVAMLQPLDFLDVL